MCSRLLQHRDTWVIASEETQRHSRNFNTFKPWLHSAKVNRVKFVKPEQAVRSSSQRRVFRFRISTKTASQSQLLQFFKLSLRNEKLDFVINIRALDVRRDETWLQSRTLCQAKYESQASRQNLHTLLNLKSCGMVKWGKIWRNTTSSQGRLKKFDKFGRGNEERTSAILVYNIMGPWGRGCGKGNLGTSQPRSQRPRSFWSAGDCDLWPGPIPEVRDSRTFRHSAHAQSQVWQIWLVLVSIYCVYIAIQNRNVVRPGQKSRFPSAWPKGPLGTRLSKYIPHKWLAFFVRTHWLARRWLLKYYSPPSSRRKTNWLLSVYCHKWSYSLGR